MKAVGKTGKLWRPVSPAEVDEWKSLVKESGLTLREVGRRFGRDHRVIAYHVKERRRKATPKETRDKWRKSINGTLTIMLMQARRRATLRELEIDIDLPYVRYLYDKQEGRCLLTGLPFQVAQQSEYRANPFVPSIDRIDSTKGYTKQNTRLVLYAINSAMNEWGEEVFALIARNYVKHQPD